MAHLLIRDKNNSALKQFVKDFVKSEFERMRL